MTLLANMAYKKKDVLDGEVLEEFWLFASCVVLTDVSRECAKSQGEASQGFQPFAPLRETSLTNPVFNRNGGEPDF